MTLLKSLKKVSLMLVCLLLAIELSLRFSSADILRLSGIIRDSSDPVLGYELAPGAKTDFNGSFVRIPESKIEISRQGFRDLEFPLDKIGERKRVAIVGDSFVFGQGVNAQDSLPAQLADLSNTLPAGGWRVMNCGVIGYNLIQELRLLETRVMAFNPDMVILFINGGDIESRVAIPRGRLTGVLFKYSYLYRQAYLYRDNLERKKEYSGPGFENAIREAASAFSRIKEITGGRPVYLVIKNYAPWMKEITAICANNGIEVLDLSMQYNRFKREIIIAPGDEHFNAKGNRLAASEIFKFLKQRI